MRYILENECLKVEIDSFGAEVKSVYGKKNHIEYMWCGDKKYWGRTAPVLFPFVGSLKNKEYKYEGKTYVIGVFGCPEKEDRFDDTLQLFNETINK